MIILICREILLIREMVSLEEMPQTDAVCECGLEYNVRIWPDGALRAVGTGGECACGKLSFHKFD